MIVQEVKDRKKELQLLYVPALENLRNLGVLKRSVWKVYQWIINGHCQ
jgi:hypothetical protein